MSKTDMTHPTTEHADLIDRLSDEADLCRNDGADDIAKLLDEARAALLRSQQLGQDEREAFEAWMLGLGYYEPYDLHELANGDYLDPHVNGRWAAWQAARLSAPQAAGQSIESAPKGVEALLFSSRNGRWFIGDWGDYDHHNHPRVTRWMPLPPTPAGEPT